MANGRPYVVPMTLDETLNRLDQITAMGMRVSVTRESAAVCHFNVRHVRVGRNGREKILDTAQGSMVRIKDDHTQVEPQMKVVALWRLWLVYTLLLTLGIVLALGIALATEGIIGTFDRRALVLFILYLIAFLVLQPQRLFLGSANDNRLNEYIQSVLSGPYSDANNLYALYFTNKRYWETR